ncbi:uncharacterized protein LOC125021543 [Mugil cephalus]|uniref:uncharacterized protein LOC125021543 n=1 Tax=Mugil cephalus TaxID=48193 RepID=UPI001FB6B68A|nr:uncharacterized protein LOC125021543 [Mugil cephalus]
MTPHTLALCLFWLYLGSSAQKTGHKSSRYVNQKGGLYSADVGGSVTLRCFYEGDAVMFYWYKQTLGQKPTILSTFYKHEQKGIFRNEFRNSSRFTLDTGNGKNHLTISDLHTSDSATYYCIGVFLNDFEFGEGAMVSVKGSGLNLQALVHHSDPETVQPVVSMTLKCTVLTRSCDGEHSVYWFKKEEESHPGLIYTSGGTNDQCNRTTNIQTHTCIYNVPMNNSNQPDTDSCAVASCGHILFGNKEKYNEEHKAEPLTLVYFLSGGLAFNIILIVSLGHAVYKTRKIYQCKGSKATSTAACNPNAEGCQDSDSLHYAALRGYKVKRPARQRDNTASECVYSGVKQ